MGEEGGIDQSCSLSWWRILKATCKTWGNADRIFLGRREQTGKSGWANPGLGFLRAWSASLAGWESFFNGESGYWQVTPLVERREGVLVNTSAEPNPSLLSEKQHERKARKCLTCMSSVPLTFQTGQEWRKENESSQEGNSCLPPLLSPWEQLPIPSAGCDRVWVLHPSDSSISLTSMAQSGLWEPLCLPAWGLCVPKWFVLTLEVMISGGRKAAWLLQRWHTTGRPQPHFDCQAPCPYFIPITVRCLTYKFFQLFPFKTACCVKCMSIA